MFLLDYLKKTKNLRTLSRSELVSFEYRLVCSGALYNRTVNTTNWKRNNESRLLLDDPFQLSVCSIPLDDYPQELCLRFKTNYSDVDMSYGVIVDLPPLLTLLFRRLITVAANVREVRESENGRHSSFFTDRPLPFTRSINVVNWPRGKDVIDYHPQPVGANPDVLKKLLFALKDLEYSEAIILSAKLYATALEMIETRPEISYLLLISCAEVMANKVLKKIKPSPDDRLKTKRPVYDLAKKFGLKDEKAKELALAACKDNQWSKWKFKKFLIDNVTEDLWTKRDSLHIQIPKFNPNKDDFEESLGKIYEIRSNVLHSGASFPPTATIGQRSRHPSPIQLIDPKKPFPPITWFERVVRLAIVNFIKKTTGLNEEIAREDDEERLKGTG